MSNALCKICYILKFFLFAIAFVSTLYILIYMYHRLGKSLLLAYKVFLPYVLLFITYCINIIADNKRVKKSLFYNVTSVFVFALISFVSYRAIFDTYMLSNIKLGYSINFNYFNDFIIPMKIMLYGLFFTNILLMANFKTKEILTTKV